MAGFEPATPASMGPQTVHLFSTPDDPAAVIGGEPLRRVIALRQRAQDIHKTMPEFETIREAADIKAGHAKRIADLLRPRSEGGFGQPEDAGAVIAERRKLQLASDELKRVQTLKETRSGRWNAAARHDQAVRDWLLGGGIPSGCRIEAIEDAALSELLTKADGNRIDAAIDRNRLRLRELAADLHKVRSAPWPSAVAKAKVKAQIDAFAEAGTPDVDRCIEHGLPILFPSTSLVSVVRNVDAQGAAAFSEVPDTFGTLCWIFRDQMLAKVSAMLDEIADDKSALSQEQREQMEAQITADMLAVERSECALIWHADRDGETFDFRSDSDPRTVLGVTLVTAPGVAARGSSPMHAYDLVGARRR